ncbi:hypothetical protein FNH05_05510 [Amycolatopsis rhizosphaerae]|uniref:Uncharacterized protein n=1 Tax=Amycolatopsis rhizosphaerae TaxID=2053003 RepID=A0A558DE87_9PSEU|nr:hypothetical protein FNH05_05510 [Amycolatopsis rhizosphaerae]
MPVHDPVRPAFGLVLRPEIAALSMSGSSLIVALNALALKRLRLPAPWPHGGASPGQDGQRGLSDAHQEADRGHRADEREQHQP